MIYSQEDLKEVLKKEDILWMGKVYSPRFDNFSKDIKNSTNLYGKKMIVCRFLKGNRFNIDFYNEYVLPRY